MLGDDAVELGVQTVWDLAPFRNVQACKNTIARLHQTNSVRYDDWVLETSKGTSIDVEMVSNLYQVDGAKVVQCHLRDITDRRQAEDRISSMALHYALPGLPNQTVFKDRQRAENE